MSLDKEHLDEPREEKDEDGDEEEEEEEEKGDDDDDEEEVDPRIQVELNRLNEASNEINKYENELDEARSKHRTTLTESSQELKSLSKNMRKTISRARNYYELKAQSKRAQAETIRAAGLYQTANSVYRAAKETIMLAEEKLTHEGQTAELSAAWQEMLNHATIRVVEAEKEKRMSEEEHSRTAKTFAELELQLQMNEKLFPKAIVKARAYFEKKAEMEQELEDQKRNVIFLQEKLQEAKSNYSGALKNLERISEELHEKRKLKAVLQYPREPGVGAESENSKCDAASEMNLGSLNLSSLSTESEGEYSSETSSLDEIFNSETQDTDLQETVDEKRPENFRDLADYMHSSPMLSPDSPFPLIPPAPPTTPSSPTDSIMSPPFSESTSTQSKTFLPFSPSSSSTSFLSCTSGSLTSMTSTISKSFSSISLNQSSTSPSPSGPASPDGESSSEDHVPPLLEKRSVEGALSEDDVPVSERQPETNAVKPEREKVPIKIFTAFRQRFLSKPIVRAGAKVERQDTSEDEISL